MEIDIIKSNVPLETIITKYTITNRGMIGSLRRECNSDLTLGR